MSEATVDSIMYFFLGLLAIFVSVFLLTFADFNATYIFKNAGVVDPATRGFFEWLAYVGKHPEQLLASLKSTFWSGLLVPFFGAPALAILVLWGHPRPQRWIVFALLGGTALDLLLLLQYHGYNSGNGGYDGGEGIVLSLLHCVFGLLAVSFALGRASAARSTGALQSQ